MKCSKAQRQFESYHRSGNGSDDPALISHVNTCPRCSEAFRKWAEITGIMERAGDVQAPEGLEQRIYRAVETEKEKKPASLFGVPGMAWGISLLVVAIITGSFFLFRGDTRTETANVVTVPKTHFEFTSEKAARVALVGDFNGWDTERDMMTRKDEQTWVIDVDLQPGNYQYQFLIDGNEWQADDANSTRIPDGFGGFNSGLEL